MAGWRKEGDEAEKRGRGQRDHAFSAKGLTFILQVMGSMKRFPVGEKYNEIFL